MSEPHMKHTEWNYIIWFTLIGWSDCFSKLRLKKLQTALVNSPLLHDISTENISLSDIFWMSVKLDRYLIKWCLGFWYAVPDIIKWNLSSTDPSSHMTNNLLSRGVLHMMQLQRLWEFKCIHLLSFTNWRFTVIYCHILISNNYVIPCNSCLYLLTILLH